MDLGAGGSPRPYAISGEALAATRSPARGIELFALTDGATAVAGAGLAGLRQTVDVCGGVAIGPAAGRTSGMIGVDPATGATRWVAPEVGVGSGAPGTGTWRVFCAGGAVALAVEEAGPSSRLRAFDAATGAPRWQVDPLVFDDVRSSDDAVFLDGAGADGRSIQALDLDDGSVRWERDGDRNLVLGGAHGVLVERGAGAERSLEVLDAASGATVLTLPGRYEPFEGRDRLAGSIEHPALVLERGLVVSAAGVADIGSIPGPGPATMGTVGTVGTTPSASPLVFGSGPDGLVWVTRAGQILLLDVVELRVVASLPGARGFAATDGVAVLVDGSILRVRKG